jgi:DNA polymerase-1
MEADDLLGSYAIEESEAGGRTLIFTGDRDMFQCANDSVTVLLAARGGPQLVDAAEVEKRYGIPPALVPDFIALRGDPSDGIPGAKGIGEKTAADILRRHGSLEAALDAAPGGTPLASAREQLLAFKDIAKLRRIDVKRPPDRPTDYAGGAEAARKLGLNRLAERLSKAS